MNEDKTSVVTRRKRNVATATRLNEYNDDEKERCKNFLLPWLTPLCKQQNKIVDNFIAQSQIDLLLSHSHSLTD